MASVVARFDRGEGPGFGGPVVGRRAAIAGVVAGVLVLHAALIVAVRWEAPGPHAMPMRMKIVSAVLIAPIEPDSHKIEEPARRSSPSRSFYKAMRSVERPPAQTRPVVRAHMHDIPRAPLPPAAPLDAHVAPGAVTPTERIAGPPPEPAPVAQAPVADTPRRVAHLDCALTKPDYPAQSLRRAEAGTAVVELDTAVDGHVVAARVATTSGYARLDEAARAAALASRCQPYAENGKPMPARADVPFAFTLSE